MPTEGHIAGVDCNGRIHSLKSIHLAVGSSEIHSSVISSNITFDCAIPDFHIKNTANVDNVVGTARVLETPPVNPCLYINGSIFGEIIHPGGWILPLLNLLYCLIKIRTLNKIVNNSQRTAF